MGAWEAWSFGTISPVSTFSRSCRRVPWKTMESVPITPSISLSREDFPGKYIRVLQAPDLLHPVPEYRRDAPEGDQLLPGVEEGGEDRHPCPGPLRLFQEIGDMPLPDLPRRPPPPRSFRRRPAHPSPSPRGTGRGAPPPASAGGPP